MRRTAEVSDPTPGQLAVLRVVAQFRARKGFAPSIRELCAALNLRSTNDVAERLSELERKRLITRVPKQCRTAVITRAGSEWLQEGA